MNKIDKQVKEIARLPPDLDVIYQKAVLAYLGGRGVRSEIQVIEKNMGVIRKFSHGD